MSAEPASTSLSRISQLRSPPNTPSTRTGPPRSLSFAYSLPNSPSRHNTQSTIPDFPPDSDDELLTFSAADREFKSALEIQDLKGKKKETRHVLTHTLSDSESWNPMRWFQESPNNEKQLSKDYGFPIVPDSSISEDHADRSEPSQTSVTKDDQGRLLAILPQLKPRQRRGASFNSPISLTTPQARLRRTFSVPHPNALQIHSDDTALPPAPTVGGSGENDKENPQGRAKWARLRSLLPHITHSPSNPILPGPSTLTSQAVNIIDELITGPLAILMPRLYFDRDEKGHRRVPILFHRLRIRVSDSLHPMHKTRSVFRIECEYFNGTVRWVVYRELRDFLTLHGHYKVAMLQEGIGGGAGGVELPEFPTTSIPYFKFLKKQGRERGNKVGKADFARLQREQLENYLIKLIRAVMFHPSSNRLAAFLEISALSISLAQSGGAQYKAGYLRIDGGGSRAFSASGTSTFGRKSSGWKERQAQRWCAVRESYLVVLDEPGELTVWEVFMLDSDFKIERPKRYYRQGLGLLHHDHKQQRDGEKEQTTTSASGGTVVSSQPHTHFAENAGGHSKHSDSIRIQLDPTGDNKSAMSSIRSRVSKIFHLDAGSNQRRVGASTSMNGHANPDPSQTHSRSRTRDRSQSQSHTTREGTDASSIVSSGSSDSTISRVHTPMLDPSTNANPLLPASSSYARNFSDHGSDDDLDGTRLEAEKEKERKVKKKKKVEKDVSKHTFYVVNSQMRLKLFARNERQMLQFITALERTAQASHYTGRNRFESFAPIRLNVAAQWLVDGRDYFWNLSRAILLAKESIHIHDWWLSPELLMRRPNKEKYRLDKLLERKAKEGVKIYIILYLEVSNRTTPTDSNYAKQRLTSLHPNILVQRSPSHFQTGTFYWAHHEKMCVIDQTIAFMGGLDLCFGRWDTPQHVLTDDMLDTDQPEIWPGKDYSNPRISDFHSLNKPEESMYDRTKIPRMPWHDVAIQIVGQPARDLARHFVQRWNYLLRIKNHSRVMPFLLPPSEFRPGELAQMGLTGTCELQICRSAGPWSMGTPSKIERSIQNAYLKAIQMSEHFVYIENQFFITSTVVNDVKVENNIGDALVQRIIRAHRDKTPWKCCIVIPLLPGFTFPVDHSDASAIRIILECQNRTIARGPDSIFSRLRKEGIDPDEYISVFSLRNWAKMRGDVLTTEQVYIHGKVCIVDDRLAIIGSANINERSQKGDRDSELASVIRDTDMMNGTMAGKPFKVGRFAHTLRMRLMREHLGVDVDALDVDDLIAHEPVASEHEQAPWDPDLEQVFGQEDYIKHIKQKIRMGNLVHTGIDSLHQVVHAGAEIASTETAKGLHSIGLSRDSVTASTGDDVLDAERKDFNSSGDKRTGFASSVVPTLEEKAVLERRPCKDLVEDIQNGHNVQQQTIQEESPQAHDSESNWSTPSFRRESPEPRTDDGVLYGAPANARRSAQVDDLPPRSPSDLGNEEEKAAPEPRSTIRKYLSNRFSHWTVPTPRVDVDPQDFEDPISDAFWKDIWVASAVHNTEIYRKVFHAIPDDLITTWKQYKDFVAYHERLNKPNRDTNEPTARVPSESEDESAVGQESMTVDHGDGVSDYSKEIMDENSETITDGPQSASTAESKPRRSGKGIEPFEKWERDEMENLLEELNGHLVVYPNRFLEGEDVANNFLFNADRLLPLPIYD